jgi:hypothetical protein
MKVSNPTDERKNLLLRHPPVLVSRFGIKQLRPGT